MSAQLLDGRALAKQLREGLKKDFAALRGYAGLLPTLAVLRVGDDDASAGYARAIQKSCDSVGVEFHAVELPYAVQQEEVEETLADLNSSPSIHGIMILEPIPAHIALAALIDRINPAKDVDGVHPINAGRLAADRQPYFVPATPAGGIRLLEAAGVDFKGKEAVVVGRSDIVGKPMALLLLHRHCTVTLAHSRTVDLPAVCRRADILCLAVGRPELVRADWVKPGAVVVDFGTTYTEAGLKGDCDQAGVAERASLLTPVPGGTGPMTNVMLMENLLRAAERAASG